MGAALSSLNYQLQYYYQIMRHVCHPHHAKIGQPKPIVRSFVYDETLQQEWYELFRYPLNEQYIPFMYFLKVTDTTMAFFEVLDAYGLNLTNVLHAKSSLWLGSDQYQFIPGHRYSMNHAMCDIIRIADDRICFIGRSSLYDGNGNHILDIKNAFLINGLSKDESMLFDALHHYHKHIPQLFTGLSKRPPQLTRDPAAMRFDITIPHHIGKNYGLLSGDINPIHTNAFLAKLTGAKGPFIQGLCTLNFAIGKLATAANLQLEKINITFCHKIYEDQTIHLLLKNNYYELVDNQGVLLAFGRVHAT